MATLYNARTGLGRKPALLIIDANGAMQCDFKLVVVREGSGDRDPQAHRSNLRDLDLKYGDVVGCDEFMTLLEHSIQGSGATATGNQAQKAAA